MNEHNDKAFSVSLFAHPEIHHIVQLSWRRYPSIAIQGNTLNITLHSLERVKGNIEEGDYAEAIESLELMVDNLKALQQGYEMVIKEYGISRSY